MRKSKLESSKEIGKVEEDKIKKHVHPKSLTNITLTEKQKKIIQVFNNNTLTVVQGPAGTSKTFISCYYAIKLLMENKIEKIILTKPIEESGEKLGFLPGTIDEKIAPFMESFKGNFLKLISKVDYEKLIKNEIIQYKPLAYLRGTGFDNCCMIGDEFQNTSWKQIMLYVTRLGENSKMIIAGDVTQYDIQKDMMALTGFSKMVEDIEGCELFNFEREDIKRNPLLIEITDKYEKLKYTGQIKEEGKK